MQLSRAVRAIVATTAGGPDVLELQDVAEPDAGPGRLLVQVETAGVNFRDVYERRGGYEREPPFVSGVEGAGTVVAVGEGVPDFTAGDRVAWASGPGSYAERVSLDAWRAVPVPEGLSTELAAAVMLQGLTAHYLARSTYQVGVGDTVLVHAAAGGVGRLLTQVVKLRGGRVLATASTAEKAGLARMAGADETMGYEGFAERVRELTDGAGLPAVYDGVGAATFDDSLASLRPRGTMVLYGAASGRVPPVEPLRLMAASLFLTRPSLKDYVATREELLWRAGEVFDWVASGRLDVRIGGRYGLEEARRAHEDLESRSTTGKLVLKLA